MWFCLFRKFIKSNITNVVLQHFRFYHWNIHFFQRNIKLQIIRLSISCNGKMSYFIFRSFDFIHYFTKFHACNTFIVHSHQNIFRQKPCLCSRRCLIATDHLYGAGFHVHLHHNSDSLIRTGSLSVQLFIFLTGVIRRIRISQTCHQPFIHHGLHILFVHFSCVFLIHNPLNQLRFFHKSICNCPLIALLRLNHIVNLDSGCSN